MIRIRTEEAFRYMGCTEANADAALLKQLSEAETLLKSHAVPQSTHLRLPLTAGPCLGPMRLFGADIARHLHGCTAAYAFAATLGAEADRCIARAMRSDISLACVLQAAAASAIECFCDEVCASLAEREGGCLKSRFSPGYGDFPIEQQDELLALLQAEKRIGLCATRSHMLTPMKSVTAVIGIGGTPEKQTEHKCSTCGKLDCTFRKE